MAGATPVAALDMWEVATRTYKLNFPDATTYTTKAGLLSPEQVSADIGHCDSIARLAGMHKPQHCAGTSRDVTTVGIRLSK